MDPDLTHLTLFNDPSDSRFRRPLDPKKLTDAYIVIIDDEETVIDVLTAYLNEEDYDNVTGTTDSFNAIEFLKKKLPDLIIMDFMMPRLDGFDLLSIIRADARLAHIPVVMLTSAEDFKVKLRALELGASDFLFKPVDPCELNLRIRNNLLNKAYQDQLGKAWSQSEQLLKNLLPEHIIERIKQGETEIADSYRDVTVLFADLVGFKKFSSSSQPSDVVKYLSYVFGEFDKVVNKYKLDKIKTVGDAYLLVGGLSGHYTDHPETVVLAATKMKKVMDKTRDRYVPDVDIRIGIHTGPVTAGIIGSGNYFYDIWGDTVNIANRLEDTCPPGQIQMSEETMQRVKDLFPVKHRGVADIKGKGEMNLFCIE